MLRQGISEGIIRNVIVYVQAFSGNIQYSQIIGLKTMDHLAEEDESSGRRYLGFTDPLAGAH